MNLTVKCKLNPSYGQRNALLKGMSAFNRAANFASLAAFRFKIYDKISLHNKIYHHLRNEFELPSQMAVRVIGKVVDTYADKHKRKSSHEFSEYGAIDYDNKNLSINTKDKTISVSTPSGRLKSIPYSCGKDLSQYELCSQSKLIYDKQKKTLHVAFCVKTDCAETYSPIEYIGVDLGIKNIAVTSENQFFSGENIEKNRKKFTNRRKSLQAKGTKSAKRKLVKIGKKQSNFVKNTNHCTSKLLVATAKTLGKGLALEDLSRPNLSKSKNPAVKFNKPLKESLGNWAFWQLRQFIEYKAKIAGVPVILVNPAYTSQRCSVCKHTCESNRVSQSEFVCQKCGLKLNADLNAAINIAALGNINCPNVDATLGKIVRSFSVANCKPPALAAG